MTHVWCKAVDPMGKNTFFLVFMGKNTGVLVFMVLISSESTRTADSKYVLFLSKWSPSEAQEALQVLTPKVFRLKTRTSKTHNPKLENFMRIKAK